jgi:ABC-type Na+ transport system ATPase subunit NatA
MEKVQIKVEVSIDEMLSVFRQMSPSQQSLFLAQLEDDLLRKKLKNAIKPIRQSLSLNEILTEQKFAGVNRAQFDALIDAINLQGDTDELLKMID